MTGERAMLSPDRIPETLPPHHQPARDDYDSRPPRHRASSRKTGATSPKSRRSPMRPASRATDLHHLFRRWAGLTPKAFLQAITLDNAREPAARFGERARRQLRGRPVRPGPAARPVRHPRGDVAGRMEDRRRRADRVATASTPRPFGTRAGDDDAARPVRASPSPTPARSAPRSTTCAALADARSYVEDQAAHRADRRSASSTRDAGARTSRCASC